MKIAVICGGLSAERDVSISTGTGAANALRKRGHQVALVDLFMGVGESVSLDTLFTSEDQGSAKAVGVDEPDLEKVREKRGGRGVIGPHVLDVCLQADFVFLALHGAEGENGKLQACLDLYGIPYTGSGYIGSALAMDKDLSKVMFKQNGIPTPPGILLHKGDAPDTSMGFPCVVKPCSGGSSVGTSIVQTPDAYEKALEEAFACEDNVLVEKYVKGRELTVGVMDGKAMAVIEIIPKTGFYDYKNKYQAGFTTELCPAPLEDADTKRVQKLAEDVYAALRLEAYGRVDILMENSTGDLYCLEANTLPGMTPTSLIPQMAAVEGMDYGALCEKIIEVSGKKYLK